MKQQAHIVKKNLSAKDIRIGIVAARFNSELTDALVSGARQTFLELGGDEKNLFIQRVPGAFEIPLACKVLLEEVKLDGAVALGVIIEGDTPHFDKLCTDVTDKISSLMLMLRKPIGFGVVMAHNQKQADERCLVENSNKGREAMLAAVEMASFYLSRPISL